MFKKRFKKTLSHKTPPHKKQKTKSKRTFLRGTFYALDSLKSQIFTRKTLHKTTQNPPKTTKIPL